MLICEPQSAAKSGIHYCVRMTIEKEKRKKEEERAKEGSGEEGRGPGAGSKREGRQKRRQRKLTANSITRLMGMGLQC